MKTQTIHVKQDARGLTHNRRSISGCYYYYYSAEGSGEFWGNGSRFTVSTLEVTVRKMAWMGGDRNRLLEAGNLHSCQNQIFNAFSQRLL